MSTTDYIVYGTPMIAHQEGERYIHEMDGYESEEIKVFDTLDEAIAYAEGVEIDKPSVCHTKLGLDSVVYYDIDVYSSEYDEEHDDWLPFEAVYHRSGMTDKWRDAMRAYEVSYWKWLDYESSDRLTLEECLERGN